MRYAIIAILLAGVLSLWWIIRSQETPAPRINSTRQDRVIKSDAEWQAILTPEQYRVTRCKGTEPRNCGVFTHKGDGVFHCVCCDLPLFDSKAKYESGTGWPSFWQPVDENNVSLVPDDSLWMRRTEVICSRCDAHLGHVFTDGPPPTGLRYCMNSAALKLVERKDSGNKSE
jgi:peptide-methionine (R)-S-oxide reductase